MLRPGAGDTGAVHTDAVLILSLKKPTGSSGTQSKGGEGGGGGRRFPEVASQMPPGKFSKAGWGRAQGLISQVKGLKLYHQGSEAGSEATGVSVV